MTNLNIVIIF